MLRALTDNQKKGQGLVEYVIVIGIIIIVLFGMTTMVRRGAQGLVKVVADQIGNQQNGEQLAFIKKQSQNIEVLNPGESTLGYLKSSYTTTRGVQDHETRETPGGSTSFIFGDMTATSSNALENLGFTKIPNL